MQTENQKRRVIRLQKIFTQPVQVCMLCVIFCACMLYEENTGHSINIWGIVYVITGLIYMEDTGRAGRKPVVLALHCTGLLLIGAGLLCCLLMKPSAGYLKNASDRRAKVLHDQKIIAGTKAGRF